MQCVVEGNPYTVFGYKGKQVRDNIHSHDCRGHRPVLPSAAGGEVYNIGGGRFSSCSVLEAIALCEEIAGKRLTWQLRRTRTRAGDHIWWISSTRKFSEHYPDVDAAVRSACDARADARGPRGPLGVTEAIMSLETNLRAMERTREAYWRRYPATSPVKLRWRALTVRHCFHVLPGESILELGAGSGLWTEHLAATLRGENPLTAAVFNQDLALQAEARKLPNTRVVCLERLGELPEESFDYIVGTAILCHNAYAENLAALYRLLKPGGQLLFFEANYWNPQVFLKNRRFGRSGGMRAMRSVRSACASSS